MSTPVETKRSNPARIAGFVGAGVVALVALALIAVGGLSLWANGQKDDDGYLSTGSDRFATSTYALATDNLDVDSQGAGQLTLTWDVEHGSWSVVVMNDDGSRGVDAGVSAGANVPILPAIGWGALG